MSKLNWLFACLIVLASFVGCKSNNGVDMSDFSMRTDGSHVGHEFVDLGLSVKWATTNIGASASEQYGNYFAWGEVADKSDYGWSTYAFCNRRDSLLTKYCYLSSLGYTGYVDTLKTLSSQDDVAAVQWGGSWRIPTREEWSELCDTSRCVWLWTTKKGVKGCLVKGKETGRSIFLPAAGYRLRMSLYSTEILGDYWTSDLDPINPYEAFVAYFNDSNFFLTSYERQYGRCIRAVTSIIDEPDTVEDVLPQAVDLGVSVEWADINMGASSPAECGSYYAWGETISKESYSWANYSLCFEGNTFGLLKYCLDSDYGNDGFLDGKELLDSIDDVAHVRLGESWRIPTSEEWSELMTSCTWTLEMQESIRGFKVTGNGNSIFLPLAGISFDGVVEKVGAVGNYWSASIDDEECYNARGVCLGSSSQVQSYMRAKGLSIRAVKKK